MEMAAYPEAHTLSRTPRGWRFQCGQVLERPRADVFRAFERPENLARITPAFLRFRILTPSPVPMHVDARIDYALSLFGVPLRWRTRITRHEPGRVFVDEQERGPFATWIHAHEFLDHPRGTWMGDTVEFAAPLGPVGRIAEACIVKHLVVRIFAHRRAAIPTLFDA